MSNFVPLKRAKDVPMWVLSKENATVNIEAGDFCTIDPSTGLAIRATATSTQLAYVYAVDNEKNTVLVEAGSDVVYEGTADANFAIINTNTEVDLAIDGGGNQLIDLGASTTDVLKVVATKDAGTVGSTKKVLVKINKPLAI